MTHNPCRIEMDVREGAVDAESVQEVRPGSRSMVGLNSGSRRKH